MDFVLAAIPWTFLPGLTLRRREKIGVGVAMSMGIMSVQPSQVLMTADTKIRTSERAVLPSSSVSSSPCWQPETLVCRRHQTLAVA
jgi:hypothetical protein